MPSLTHSITTRVDVETFAELEKRLLACQQLPFSRQMKMADLVRAILGAYLETIPVNIGEAPCQLQKQ